MISMAAIGIPLTPGTLEDLPGSESGAESVTEALSSGSHLDDEDGADILDGVLQTDEDSEEDRPSRYLSDISVTPSLSCSSSGHSVLFSDAIYGAMATVSTAPHESTRTRPTISTMGLGYSPNINPANLLAVSVTDSESEQATERLHSIAFAVRELNLHTPISPAS
jgi:hypothetical protein